MAVTGDHVARVLCVYVNVCPSVLTERDVRKMQDEENPIPSLLDDDNGDWE